MSIPRRHRRIAAITSKTIVWLVLGSICLSSMPIPIASVSVIDSKGQAAFPCQGGHCGCKTALKCWTSCCCHTPKERLAWARQHGVAIPAYAKESLILAAQLEEKRTKPACCRQSATKASCCVVTPTTKPALKRSPQRKLVLSMLAMRCQGSSGELASMPWAVMKLFEPSVQFAMPFESELAQFSANKPARFYPPETPPPKCA